MSVSQLICLDCTRLKRSTLFCHELLLCIFSFSFCVSLRSSFFLEFSFFIFFSLSVIAKAAPPTLDARELVITDCGGGNIANVQSAMNTFGKEAVFNAMDDSMDDGYFIRLKCIHAAAHNGRDELISFLLKEGDDINSRNHHEWTPLYTAVFEGQINSTKLLLDAGANIELKAFNGMTPLHRVIKRMSLFFVPLMISTHDFVRNPLHQVLSYHLAWEKWISRSHNFYR